LYIFCICLPFWYIVPKNLATLVEIHFVAAAAVNVARTVAGAAEVDRLEDVPGDDPTTSYFATTKAAL
jgi:hypothetical protein